jgi:hypothetical protein
MSNSRSSYSWQYHGVRKRDSNSLITGNVQYIVAADAHTARPESKKLTCLEATVTFSYIVVEDSHFYCEGADRAHEL